MPQCTTAITSSGVDWLTLSAPVDGNGNHLRELGVELLMDSAKKGNRVRPFKRGTYYGGATNHVGVGEYQNRVLVELSGAVADEWWRELVPLAEKVSRIDLQVSVRQEPYDKMLAMRSWAKSLVRARAEGRPPDYDLFARRTQGSTLYIGQGASRFRARLYERWYKDPIDENVDTWRYEVQARRERALQVAGLLSQQHAPETWTQAFVHQHFDARGVPPIFAAEATAPLPPLPEPSPDRDRSLAWLARTVQPVMKRLDSWGATREALRALGVESNDVEDLWRMSEDRLPDNAPESQDL